MYLTLLARLFHRHPGSTGRRRHGRLVKQHLSLEALECRLVPSTLYVSHSGDFRGHTAYTTITAAVAAARSRDVIRIGPGDYTGEGDIVLPATKIGLELKGAQYEHNPAAANHGGRIPGDPTTESVVQGFELEGSKQEIYGFTLTSPSSLMPGIVTDPHHSGYKITYNIFTNMPGSAIEFNSAGTYHSQVEYNWFDSTSAAAGPLGPIGADIESAGPLSNAGIGKNWFGGMTTDTASYSVALEGVGSSLPGRGINIVKNIFEGAGNASQGSLLVSNAVGVNVDENTFSNAAGNDISVTGFHHHVRVRGSQL